MDVFHSPPTPATTPTKKKFQIEKNHLYGHGGAKRDLIPAKPHPSLHTPFTKGELNRPRVAKPSLAPLCIIK